MIPQHRDSPRRELEVKLKLWAVHIKVVPSIDHDVLAHIGPAPLTCALVPPEPHY